MLYIQQTVLPTKVRKSYVTEIVLLGECWVCWAGRFVFGRRVVGCKFNQSCTPFNKQCSKLCNRALFLWIFMLYVLKKRCLCITFGSHPTAITHVCKNIYVSETEFCFITTTRIVSSIFWEFPIHIECKTLWGKCEQAVSWQVNASQVY